MNLIQYFQSLPVTGKVALIAGYILMVLLIILWEMSRTHKRATTRLPTVMPAPTIEETEKLVHTVTTSPTNQNKYNTHKRGGYLLEALISNLKKCVVYCETRADGNNPAHHLQQYIVKHILIIVNKLLRRVNESGKEPGEPLLCLVQSSQLVSSKTMES